MGFVQVENCNFTGFYTLVTSKPEEGWCSRFGHLKYCFKHTTLCQLCSKSSTSHRFNFEVWLIRSPVRSDLQSSRIFVHGLGAYLVCYISYHSLHKTDSLKNSDEHPCPTFQIVKLLFTF